MKSLYVQYYVEGENEERLLHTLKTDLRVILPGKVQKFNVIEREFTAARLRPLRPGTMTVLIFDTDTGKLDFLNRNLAILRSCRAISDIVTIPQVHNLEEELVRSCAIREIRELLGSRSNSEFKSDLIRVSNLAKKLREHHFCIEKFWAGVPTYPYSAIPNQAAKVKLSK